MMTSLNQTMTYAAAGTVLMIVAHQARAVPQGAHWRAIANCTNPVTGESTGLEVLWRTYDLYVDLEPGDVVGAIDFGIAGGNFGLSTDGDFFQTPPPFGGDSVVQNESFAAFSPTVPFDTAVAMGDEDLSFAAVMDWDPAGVTGAWFSSDQNELGGPLFVARVTVSNDAAFLGGQIFVAGTGPNGNFGQGADNLPLGVVDIPNAGFGVGECIPAPGTGAVIASVGLIALRRRR